MHITVPDRGGRLFRCDIWMLPMEVRKCLRFHYRDSNIQERWGKRDVTNEEQLNRIHRNLSLKYQQYIRWTDFCRRSLDLLEISKHWCKEDARKPRITVLLPDHNYAQNSSKWHYSISVINTDVATNKNI